MASTLTSAPAPMAAPTGSERRRAKAPTVLQMEAVECGAASLGIVLAHYGRWVPLEELRNECGVSRDGSKASNVLKAARHYGLEGSGRRMELDGLKDVHLPAIVFWNFNHFLVLEGYGPKHVYLNDPASGPRTITWDEFDGSFTGVVLDLQPTDAFVQEGAQPSLVKGLASRFHGGTNAVVLCLLAGIGLLVPGLLVPAAVRTFVNEVLSQGNRSWLPLVVVGVALAAVAQLAFTWLQQVTLLRLSTKLAMSMSTRFMEHVLRLPLLFFSQRYAGHVVTRIQINDQIASLLSSQLSASLLAMLTSVFYLVLMVIYDWQLTLVTLFFSAVNILALRFTARKQKDASRRLVQDSGKLTATAVSGLANIETLKATSEDASFFSRWAGHQAKVLGSSQDLGAPMAALSSLPAMLIALNTAALIGIGGLQVMDRSLSLGTLVAFQMLATGFSGPVAQLVGFGSVIQQAAGNLASVDDVLHYPVDPEAAERPPVEEVELPSANGSGPRRRRMPSRLSGEIDLVDISFGYNPLEPPLVRELNLHVEPGQRVAIVGPTGSGKSTVSKMVAGLNQPWGGQILFDGIPRTMIPRHVLASSLAFVDQEIQLFEGSVRDNLTLWDPTISEEAVVRGARDAAIHDDVVKRQKGYDRAIEEGGRDWSGGQRQRLEIARALAGDPAILIMDEATSALDPLVEQSIDQAIRARGCTCLIVAHRLSTIRDCDEIVVLAKGVAVERGTHDELVANGGIYAEFLNE
jgi:NHLM bacteriocin system ABC transporter peptidase/ATP-binding protein